MIIVMSQKFWIKHAPKMAEPAEYVGVDGENIAITNRPSGAEAIATKYSHFVSLGSFTPEGRLHTMLKKLKKEEEVNMNRFRNEVSLYLEDKAFISCVIKTFKALYSCGFDAHLNVFVVLPNLVYRYLGKVIIEEMIDLADLPFRFVFSQEELKEFGYDKLELSLGKKRLKAIAERVEYLNRKHKIKYKNKDDWDDD